VLGTAMRSEPTMFSGRNQVDPRAGRDCIADLYRQVGHHEPAQADRPRRDLRSFLVVRADVAREPRLRGSRRGLEAHRRQGVTEMTGDMPINPSGGVLSSNPIGASGMLRFAEAAMQVRNQAGEHQIPGARLALGHAYGGGSQFFAMWMVGADKP
jgi:acetyl-CoA C-acetyltransferase